MKEKINRHSDFIICLLLVLIAVGAYFPLPLNEFLYFDDDKYIFENPYVQRGITVDSIIWAFKSFFLSYWHPLTWISHMMDYQLFGLNAAKHHLVNLCFHIINTLLLFAALKAMTGAGLRSAIVACLFALHPLNVESVAWASERKNVLSGFFFMVTLLSYVKYTRKSNAFRYFVILIGYSMSLLSKPALVAFPFMALLLDFWPLSRFRQLPLNSSFPGYEKMKERLWLKQTGFLIYEKIPLFVLTVISVYISYSSAGHLNKIVNTGSVSLHLRIMNASVSYVKYIINTFWPSHLAVYYPFPKEISVWTAIATGSLLATMSLIVFKYRKTKPYLAVGWFWFSGSLVPLLGIIQAGSWPSMADRFMYIPMIGILIAIVWGLHDFFRKFDVGKAVVCLVAFVFLTFFWITTVKQVALWKNGVTLFENALSVVGDDWYIYKNLGVSYHHQGRLDRAGDCYRKALTIKPDSAELYNNLGVIFMAKGELNKAILHYQTAIRLVPADATSYYNFGNAMVKIGEMEKAETLFRKAIGLKPDYASAYFNLGGVLSDLGRFEQSLLYYHEYLKLRPQDEEAYYNMGDILITQGKTKEAITHFIKAAQITSDFSKAYNHVGNLFVLRGQSEKACLFFFEAIRINPQDLHLKKCIEQYCK